MKDGIKKEYSHYYKKIPSGVKYVDVYRVLELFGVSDPSIQHAVKKLLVAGGRGHKNLEKDVKEAIVSLERWIEMREEESSPIQDGPKGCDESYQTSAVGCVGPSENDYVNKKHKYFRN